MTTKSSQGEIRPKITSNHIRSSLDKQIQSLSESYLELTTSLAYMGSVQVWAMHLADLQRHGIELSDTAGEFAQALLPGSIKPADVHNEPPLSEQVAELAYAVCELYDFFWRTTGGEPLTDAELAKLQEWAETLIDVCKSHRANSFDAQPKKISLDEVLANQAKEQGIKPMPLEADLLIKRIEQGGHSGQFLADAYLSAYRGLENFNHSLKELISLDTEAFRLFHQILHIRHVPGWNDDTLYQLEQQVIVAMKEAEKSSYRRGIANAKSALNGGDK